MDKIIEKWDEILNTVKQEYEISDVSFDTWIRPLEVFAIEGNTLYILVPSEQMALSYISKKYLAPLRVAIVEITEIEYEIKFILPEEARTLKLNTKPAKATPAVTADESNLNPNYTFDTFVVGNNNRFAHSASLAVAESPGEAYNPLYIYGGPGLGKTHLITATANEMKLFKGPAKKFEEKFGVPSIRIPGLFIGATDTTKFVRAVAEALNLDNELVESVIQSEEQYVYNYLAQAIGVVSWKRFAVVADASNAVGITRYLANDFSFTPVLVIISEPIFRPDDKERIVEQINDMEYAVPPKVVFVADQYEINQALLNEEKEITLLIGSSNDREVALEKDIQFILASFPMSERLIFNRTYAGYRGSLTFTEDLYDNL